MSPGIAPGLGLARPSGMRAAVLCTLALLACRGSSPTAPPTVYRFLPASPELVVRLDLVRVRAWPLYAKAAPVALAGVEKLLDSARQRCKLDVVAEAQTVVVARRGALLAGDLTLIATGLDRARVTACVKEIASATFKVAIDGELFQVEVAGRSIASAAFLPGGELVVVSRGGAGVAPDAWRTEVTQGAAAIPAYWSTIDAAAPVALRVADDHRTVVASAQLGDPLRLTGSVTAASEQLAQEEERRMQAILSYLTQADAGTGTIQTTGKRVDATFTATGVQAEHFITIALPAAMGTTAPTRDIATAATDAPGDCGLLADAVQRYITETLSKAPPERRAEMERSVTTLIPTLQRAFLETCTADRWMASAIECHVTNATNLARFERCREALPAEQRERLDKALTSALAGR